jgi:hypothetical protein
LAPAVGSADFSRVLRTWTRVSEMTNGLIQAFSNLPV